MLIPVFKTLPPFSCLNLIIHQRPCLCKFSAGIAQASVIRYNKETYATIPQLGGDEPNMAILTVNDITLSFGEETILEHITFEMQKGRCV